MGYRLIPVHSWECDHRNPECGHAIEIQVPKVSDARARAVAAGWTIGPRRSLCPDHRPAARPTTNRRNSPDGAAGKAATPRRPRASKAEQRQAAADAAELVRGIPAAMAAERAGADVDPPF
jgi:hypothetical protein